MVVRLLMWALGCAATASSVSPRARPAPLLARQGTDRIAGQRLHQGATPIDKRVNWFISDSVAALPLTTEYLLKTNREITQGAY